MKKIILSLCMLVLFSKTAYANQLDIKASSAVMISASDGQILFEDKKDEEFLASGLNDIMLTFVGTKQLSVNDTLEASDSLKRKVLSENANLSLESGEVLSRDSVLNAIMLKSAFDAKLLLSEKISGVSNDFCLYLNEEAKKLGALNTDYTALLEKDARGYSTVYDIALILKSAIVNEEFYTIFTNEEYVIPTNDVCFEERHLKKDNPYFSKEEMGQYKIKGIKTTFTSEDKNCAAIYVKADDRDLIIVLRGGNDFKSTKDDLKRIIAYGLSAYNKVTLTKDEIPQFKDELTTYKSIEDTTFYLVAGYTKEDLKYSYSETGIDIMLPDGEVLATVKAETEEELPVYMIITRIILFALISVVVLVVVFIVMGIVNHGKKKKERKERLKQIMQDGGNVETTQNAKNKEKIKN